MSRFIIIYTSLIVLAIGAFWFFGQTFTSQELEASVVFTVEPQESVVNIAKKLFDNELISSKFTFLIYSIFSGNFSRFQPGTYVVSQMPTVRDIVSLLIGGPGDVEVVIYPGMTLKEIDERLTQSGVIEEGSLLALDPATLADDFVFLSSAQTLEGFLMPDTYRFYANDSAQNAARVMLKHFLEQAKELLTYDKEKIMQTIIIASMIEKEVIFEEEKPIVAGIIQNRLKAGMALQIDASVRYGTCQGRFTQCKELGRSDFSVDTPYNTYLYQGLPLTPISNPTRSSIDAALSPASTPYFYYLSDPQTGKSIFSKTFEEHNKKRAQYLGL